MWRPMIERAQRRGPRDKSRKSQAVRCFETLEVRTVLSTVVPPAGDLFATEPPDASTVNKAIVAGDPNGTPADSPALRIDPNTTASPFGGVGSLFMDLGGGTGFICTGTLVSPMHVLTAGHCLDADDNGSPDFAPSSVSFFLNYGGNFSHAFSASALHVHPNFTGFANPSVLDDLAVIKLSSSVPAGVPIYSLNTAPFINIETVTAAGYGTTGDGVSGYLPNSASFTVKRSGMNRAEVYLSDDEGTGAREGFEWDFDGPRKGTNVFGSPKGDNLTLGNHLETTIGGGDSGGPSFIDDGSGGLLVFGVNTYTRFGKAPAPLFGSLAGGMVVSTYAGWISSVMGGINQPPVANAGVDQSVTTGSIVQLDGSGSNDPEGDSLNYSWSLTVPAGSNAVLSNPAAVSPTFTADIDGAYVATLVVNDGQNNSAPDSATITAGPAASSMHVGDIDGSSQVKGKSGKWSADVSVSIHDNHENPVPGATVTGRWSGAAGGTISGVTGAGGSVTFATGNLNSGTSVTFEILNVTNTLNYDAGANHDPDGDSNGTTITVDKGSPSRTPLQIRTVHASPIRATVMRWFPTSSSSERPGVRDALHGEVDESEPPAETALKAFDFAGQEEACRQWHGAGTVGVGSRQECNVDEDLLEDLARDTRPLEDSLIDEAV